MGTIIYFCVTLLWILWILVAIPLIIFLANHPTFKRDFCKGNFYILTWRDFESIGIHFVFYWLRFTLELIF